MNRRQTNLPGWWLALDIPDGLREKLRGQFTLTRDGYARWYKGRSVTVCGKGTDPREVEARWRQRAAAIDATERGEGPADGAEPVRTYRDVLGEFLSVQKARVGAKRHPLRQRTYDNYVKDLNDFGSFVHDGAKVADTDIRAIGPAVFTGYAAKFAGWMPSGFDSIVTRVGALFNWAAEMEYLDRFRPGPQFRRPDKQSIRDDRIDKTFSFTPAEAATLYLAANPTVRCWIALGVCAAFTNSDVANVTRAAMGLDAGAVVDFRRRKTGKVRRVIPLPADVANLLRAYRRPDPADPANADLFFVSVEGNGYSRTRTGRGPSCSISRLFAKLVDDAGVEKRKGRGFKGLRTTFFNLAPRHAYDLERKIVMGRAQGTVDLDSYLEELGLDRVRHVVNHVWNQIKSEIDRLSSERPGSGPASPSAAASPAAAGPPAERTAVPPASSSPPPG